MGAALSSSTYDSPSELATKLSRKPEACMIAFLSPACGLCASLRPTLEQVDRGSFQEFPTKVNVAIVNAQQDKTWAPEMLAYNVDTVPCLVLVDRRGRAVCKTAPPRSRQQMEAALREMVELSTELG